MSKGIIVERCHYILYGGAPGGVSQSGTEGRLDGAPLRQLFH